MIRRICAWLDRRRAARAAAHARELENLRGRFPDEPEFIVRAIAAGGVIAMCAFKSIAERRQREYEEFRLRQIIREELDRHGA